MTKRATINDVAAAAQVSNGTVHRALNGKPGVSAAVRKRVLEVAHEIGYEPNIVASTLKKKPFRIIVAFPALTQFNRYFYGELWNGYRSLRRELVTYNLDIIEVPYYNKDEQSGFAESVQMSIRQFHGEIDGVIGGGWLREKDIRMVEKLIQSKIPVVLVSESVADLDCLCSIQSEHDLDGRVAAELLTAQIPAGSSILMCAGDVMLPSNSANTAGFEEFIRENDPGHRIFRLYGYDDSDFGDIYQRATDLLQNDGSIRGLYSVNARCSRILAQVVEEGGFGDRVRFVGSDLYPESAEYMRRGIIHFIIDKNPRLQARIGFQRLIDYLVRKSIPEEKEEYIASTIICRSNLERYLKNRG